MSIDGPEDLTDLRYERDGNIAVVTLNRPKVHNAVRRRSYDELEWVIRHADADAEVRVVIVTGADPAFCSGDDVREIMADGAPTDLLESGELTPAAKAILQADVPIIAAVNGVALGWGVELALMADLRIASDRARFGQIFVKRGLCVDAAGLGRLTQLVGREAAAELLLTGDIIDASKALEIGMVGRVVPHSDLAVAARDLAERIAVNPPLAVRAIKAGLRKAVDPDWDELGSWVTRTLSQLFETDDHRESVQAFLHKRKPVFRGR